MTPHPDPDWDEVNQTSSPWTYSEICNSIASRHVQQRRSHEGRQILHGPRISQFTPSSTADEHSLEQVNSPCLDTQLTIANDQVESLRSFDRDGLDLASRIENDIPDLIITNFDSPANMPVHVGQDLRLGRPVAQSDVHEQYSCEVFEQYFPSTPPQRASHSRFEQAMSHNVNHLSWVESSQQIQPVIAVSQLSNSMTTETTQGAQESVFNSTTGVEHKQSKKCRRRSPTPAQCHNRKVIRRSGGACLPCKSSKRKCSLSHPRLAAALEGLELNSPRTSETSFSESFHTYGDDDDDDAFEL